MSEAANVSAVVLILKALELAATNEMTKSERKEGQRFRWSKSAEQHRKCF